jgi:hypothetical protein
VPRITGIKSGESIFLDRIYRIEMIKGNPNPNNLVNPV